MQKSRLIILVTLTCLLLHVRLCAQIDSAKMQATDPQYVRSYAEYLHLTVMYRTDNLQYRISDADNAKFVLSPNEIYQTVLGASYAFIDVEYSFSPAFVNINNDANIKGKTKKKQYRI